jgi:nucleotide-binding universal stress UspA family protein
MASVDVVALTFDRVFAEEELAPLRGGRDGARTDPPPSAVGSDQPVRADHGLSQSAACMGCSALHPFQRILVAYDGSPQAQHAAQIALSLARLMTARVFILAVISPMEADGSPDFLTRRYNAFKGYEASFASLQEQASRIEIPIETRISIGNPVEEIVDRSVVTRASLIVMGRRSRSSLRHWLLGSDSEQVARKARCPVMLVH